jgi:ankyrin repeat protein
MTTLMYAARYTTNSEIITMLLKAGASGKAKDINGKTAFDYAKENAKLKGTAVYWAMNNARF